MQLPAALQGDVPGECHESAQAMYQANQMESILVRAGLPAQLSSLHCMLNS